MGEIGKNIRQIRVQRGMTQDDLAARIHTTRQTVSHYETGHSRPDIDTLLLVAEALDVEVELLLYGKARPAIDPRQVRRLLTGGVLTLLLFVLYPVLQSALQLSDYDMYRSVWMLPVLVFLSRAACYLFLGWTAAQALYVIQKAHPWRTPAAKWVRRGIWAFLTLYGLCFLQMLLNHLLTRYDGLLAPFLEWFWLLMFTLYYGTFPVCMGFPLLFGLLGAGLWLTTPRHC